MKEQLLKFWQSLSGVNTKDILNVTLSVFIISCMFAVWAYIGNQDPQQYNQITVSGTADYYATPDIAAYSLTLHGEGKTAKEAQEIVVKQSDSMDKIIKEFGLESKDIKTESYTSNPKYEYKYDPCKPNTPCTGRNSVVGYEVTQTTSIKLRDLKKAGDLAAQLTALNPQNQSGPDFRVEDPEKAKQNARELAIEKAKEKAGGIADSLDMDLGKIVSFSEDGGGMYPQAVANMAYMEDSMSNVMRTKSLAPTVNPGQDKISVTVNITYKLK